MNKKLIPLAIIGAVVLFILAFVIVPAANKQQEKNENTGGLLGSIDIDEDEILMPEGMSLGYSQPIETSPPPDPVFTPMPGQFIKLVEDNFSNPEIGMQITPVHQSGFTAKYYDGGFTMYIQQAMVTGYVTKTLNTNNFLVDVTTKFTAGTECNFYGVITRYTDSDNFYYFLISNTGYYSVGKKVDGTTISLLPAETMENLIVKTGKEDENHILLLCDHDQFFFYVNEELISSVIDSDLNGYGFGFAVISGNEKGTSVSFDDLVLYSFEREGE